MTANVQSIDGLIRAGRAAEARVRLEAIAAKGRIARSQAALLAWLAWRAGVPGIGVRLLHRLVRAEGRARAAPSDRALAEYAVCLMKIGAVDEGERLLSGLDPRELPVVWLYRAFAPVLRWDYAASIPPLRSYLAAPGITAYDRLVASVNLAAALVVERDFVRADPLLRELLHRTRLRRYDFARGRVAEIVAESFLVRGKWKQGEAFLREAERDLAAVGGIDLLATRKFQAFAGFLQDPSSTEGLIALHAVRAEALACGHWETVRDCDRTEGLGRKDPQLMAHVYLGTPFEIFRHRLREALPGGYQPPSRYVWRVGSGEGGPALDLARGVVVGRRAGVAVAVGKAMHRLLAVLCSDYYRPFPTAAIHARLFPGEYYNPASSPGRVRQAVRRLRRWLEAAGMPLRIEEAAGAYRLTATASCEIVVPGDRKLTHRLQPYVDKLRAAQPEGRFSVQDASRILGVSDRSALRTLEVGLRDGALDRVGKGSLTRYEFRKKAA